MNFCTSLAFFGVGQLRILSTFFFCIFTPSGSITTPKNSTSLTFHLHLSSFTNRSLSSNLLSTSSTILSCVCCNNNVIDKCCHIPLVDHVVEQVIHYCLEGCQRIGKLKVHDGQLIGPNVCCKCCLPLITLFDPHVIVLLS